MNKIVCIIICIYLCNGCKNNNDSLLGSYQLDSIVCYSNNRRQNKEDILGFLGYDKRVLTFKQERGFTAAIYKNQQKIKELDSFFKLEDDSLIIFNTSRSASKIVRLNNESFYLIWEFDSNQGDEKGMRFYQYYHKLPE